MRNLIKVMLYIIVNIAGFFAIAIITGAALKLNIFPEFRPGPDMEIFRYWFLYIGRWVWVGCAAVSISYFFMENEWKNWILLAPMFITGGYATVVIIYFSFFYQGTLV